MRLTAILTLLALGACTAAPAIVLTAQQVQEMCQADYETAVAIAEQLDYLTDLDGPAFVREVCGPDE